MDAYTEGDARAGRHAQACHAGGCEMSCRCWCHGTTKHLNGEQRADSIEADRAADRMHSIEPHSKGRNADG